MKKLILLLSALGFLANATGLSAQAAQGTNGSDQESILQKFTDVLNPEPTENEERDAALQKNFSQFPLLSPVTDAKGKPDFQTLTLTNPVVVNHERIFGFRFTVPARTNYEDFLWSFVEPDDYKEWYIVRENGQMNGFLNYYTDTRAEYMGAKPILPPDGNRIIYQYLRGDALKDGGTYLIWMGFGNRNSKAMSVAFTFADFNLTARQPKWTMETRFSSVGDLTSEPVVSPINHHTYLLLRPTTWERAESLAKKLGGHLATIRNQAEEDWITQIFGNHGGGQRSLWIGLNDLDKQFHFSWTSGESAAYTGWAPGEPDNAGPRGHDSVAIVANPGAKMAWQVWRSQARNNPGLPMNGVVEIIPANNPATAQSVPVTNVTTTPINPDVTVTNGNGNIKLAWPVSAAGYALVATTNLSQPFARFGYSESTNSETGVIYAIITNPAAQMFFRLVKP